MTVNRANTARLGSASPPRNLRSTKRRQAWRRDSTAGAINPVIAHPVFSRGNEVANRTNLLRCMSPELALFGHDAKSDLSPLLGAKRKCDSEAVRSPFDPNGLVNRSLYAGHSGRWPRTPPLGRAPPK